MSNIIRSKIQNKVCFLIIRAWESLSSATCCRSLVVIYYGICVLQTGYADASDASGGDPVVVDADNLMRGSLYNGVVKSGSREILSWFILCKLPQFHRPLLVR